MYTVNVTILLLFNLNFVLDTLRERSVFMKFSHRSFVLAVLLLALFCVPMPAFAALNPLTVNVDEATTELQAFVEDDSVYLSVSDIAAIFDVKYTHDTIKNEVTYFLSKSIFGKKEAVFTIDSSTISVNGKKSTLDIAPIHADDTILIPAKAISIIWNASYGYNSDTLYIHTDGSDVNVPLTPKVFVEKQRVTVGEKSTIIRYIRIPDVSGIKADIVLANNSIGTTEKLQDMAARSSAKAAINGGFFQSFDNTKVQEPYGILIKDGKLIHSDNTGSTLGFMKDGSVKLDMVRSVITVQIGNVSYTASLMNHSPGVDSDTIALFTSAYGATINTTGTAVIVQNGVIQNISSAKALTVPKDGYVVLFTGEKSSLVKNLQKGDAATYAVSYTKSDWSDVQTAIGAGPILVSNGKVVCDPAREGFTDATSFQMAVARSAVGITEDNTILLIGSVKCTAEELANIMLELGAVQAIAMDSGSSSGLYSTTDDVVAAPMKAISNALIFK